MDEKPPKPDRTMIGGMPNPALKSVPFGAELIRMKYAFWLAVLGLGLSAAIVIFLVTVPGMKDATSITAIVGLFTSVTGTLVGAFFGLQIGSAGVEQQRADRIQAEKTAQTALAMLDPKIGMDVMKMMSEGQ